MIRLTNHQYKAIRFRRWGRAGYSAFRSMSREVTIGQLVNAVSDKSLLKAKTGVVDRFNGSLTAIENYIAELFDINDETEILEQYQYSISTIKKENFCAATSFVRTELSYISG